VVTTASGLQYKVTTSGPKTGPSPKLGDIVKVHYEGKLLDGTVFDSSFERGQAAIMPADGLIPGWLEALPLMHVGDEWTLWIPAELAYGERSHRPDPGQQRAGVPAAADRHAGGGLIMSVGGGEHLPPPRLRRSSPRGGRGRRILVLRPLWGRTGGEAARWGQVFAP
jgi:hypothetical protein